jgi:hypothetical protein
MISQSTTQAAMRRNARVYAALLTVTTADSLGFGLAERERCEQSQQAACADASHCTGSDVRCQLRNERSGSDR